MFPVFNGTDVIPILYAFPWHIGKGIQIFIYFQQYLAKQSLSKQTYSWPVDASFWAVQFGSTSV